MKCVRSLTVAVTITLSQVALLKAEADEVTQRDHKVTVLTCEDYLFPKEAAAFQVDDAKASGGSFVQLVRDGKVLLPGVRCILDYSTLQIGRKHTLYAVIRIVHHQDAGRLFTLSLVPLGDPSKTVRLNIPTRAIKSSTAWQTVRLASFDLPRDLQILLFIAPGARIDTLAIDKFVLTSDYVPPARDRRVKWDNRISDVANCPYFRDNFDYALVLRIQNPQDEPLQPLIEREIADAKRHYVRTIVLTGIVQNLPVEEYERLMEKILTFADAIGVKLIIPIHPYFPESWTSRKAKRTRPTVKATPHVRSVVRRAARRITARFRHHRSLLAYNLIDEPYPHQLPLHLEIKRALYESDPAHPLLTAYQAPHQVSVFANYEPVLCSGFYPLSGRFNDADIYRLIRGYRRVIENIKARIYPGVFMVAVQGFSTLTGPRMTRAMYRLQVFQYIMGGADGIINYIYHRASRRLILGGENYGFVDSLERPYDGQYDLWEEVRTLGERFDGLENLLCRMKPASAEGISVSFQDLRPNGDGSSNPDIAVKRTRSGYRLIILNNPDCEQQHCCRLRISHPLMAGHVLLDLFTLEPCSPENEASVFAISLPPGDAKFLLLVPSGQAQAMIRSIRLKRLKTEYELFLLQARTPLLSGMHIAKFAERQSQFDAALAAGDIERARAVLAALKTALAETVAENAAFRRTQDNLNRIRDILSKISADLAAATLTAQQGRARQKTDPALARKWRQFDQWARQYFRLLEAFRSGKYLDIAGEVADLLRRVEQGQANRGHSRFLSL